MTSSSTYFSRWLIRIMVVQLSWEHVIHARKLRSVDDLDTNPLTNSVEFIWSTTTVAVGDTAVLHCSFDAIFQQLRTGNIDWYREVGGLSPPTGGHTSSISISAGGTTLTKRSAGSVHGESSSVEAGAVPIATGKRVVTEDGRYRVYRPHNSALSVLIIRRAKKRDAGIYRCNLSGSSTRHKYMVLNVTESKIEAQTSAATQRAKIGNDVTLWCNATGYPKPVVYWTREDRNRQLPDGSHQYWGNGLQLRGVSEGDTGIYACYLDNFVQPIVSYKFSLMVEDNPWNLDGYKMRFDSKQWYSQDSAEPKPVKTKSYLLMCETRQASKPLPIIRWYRDGNAVRNSRHFYIIEDSSDSRSSYASSTLVIMTFLPRFQGNYTCVASNVFRMKKLTFYIQEYLQNEDVDDTASAGGSALDVTSSGIPRHINIPRPGSVVSKVSLPVPSRLPFHSPGGTVVVETKNSTASKESVSQTPKVRQTVHNQDEELSPGGHLEKTIVESKQAGVTPGKSSIGGGPRSTDDEDMTAGSGDDKDEEDYEDK